MNVAGLFEDQRACAGVERLHVEIGELGDLRELLRFVVVGKDIGDAIAVGDEEDGVADPRGVHVFGIGPGRGDEVVILGVDDPDGPVLASAIIAALFVPGGVHAVGDVGAVGGDFSLIGARERERGFYAAFDWDGPEARGGVGRCGGAGRGEEDRLAVGGPALHGVGAGVKGEALGLAAFGGDDVDVGVAGVVAAEGDPFPVGGEMGIGGGSLKTGKAAGGASGAVDGPDVVGVGERDLGGADGGGAEEPCGGSGGGD